MDGAGTTDWLIERRLNQQSEHAGQREAAEEHRPVSYVKAEQPTLCRHTCEHFFLKLMRS
jgi:hypothetical protein